MLISWSTNMEYNFVKVNHKRGKNRRNQKRWSGYDRCYSLVTAVTIWPVCVRYIVWGWVLEAVTPIWLAGIATGCPLPEQRTYSILSVFCHRLSAAWTKDLQYTFTSWDASCPLQLCQINHSHEVYQTCEINCDIQCNYRSLCHISRRQRNLSLSLSLSLHPTPSFSIFCLFPFVHGWLFSTSNKEWLWM